jgi:hypothetical protein
MPANIWMQKPCQHAKSLQYKFVMAEEELLHDNTVELNPPVSATPPSPTLLLLQDPHWQDQHGPPQDLPPPRAVRRLAFEAVEMQQASNSLQGCNCVRRVLSVPHIWSARKLRIRHRPSSTSLSIGWRRTKGRSGNCQCLGTRRSAIGSKAWPGRQRTGPTGLQLRRLRPPRARINTSLTLNRRTSAAAPPLAPQTIAASMPLDCKRAAHTTFMRVLTSETLSGHVVLGFTTNIISTRLDWLYQ